MKAKFYFFLKSYFGFSQRESRGLVIVFPVLFLLYLFPSVYDWMLTKKNEQQYELYLEKIDSLIQTGWQPYQSNLSQAYKTSDQDTSRNRNNYQRPKSPQLNKMLFTEADSIVLQIVPGIGQTMAGRVVKFRENLGGLHHKEQLLEVYGMTPEVLDRVFEYFEFEPKIFRKLAVNQLDVSTLAQHPYINYGAAKVIVAYREQHGSYTQASDLLNIKIFNEEWLERLKPYLEF